MNNLSTTTVVTLALGIVLIYAAFKKMDPRDVVRKALGKEAKFGFFGTEQGFLKPINPTLPPAQPGAGTPPRFTNLPFTPSV